MHGSFPPPMGFGTEMASVTTVESQVANTKSHSIGSRSLPSKSSVGGRESAGPLTIGRQWANAERAICSRRRGVEDHAGRLGMGFDFRREAIVEDLDEDFVLAGIVAMDKHAPAFTLTI